MGARKRRWFSGPFLSFVIFASSFCALACLPLGGPYAQRDSHSAMPCHGAASDSGDSRSNTPAKPALPCAHCLQAVHGIKRAEPAPHAAPVLWATPPAFCLVTTGPLVFNHGL